jgi:hypothetical protein
VDVYEDIRFTTVYYKNGFSILYPKSGSSMSKTLKVHDIRNGSFIGDSTKLFKYFDENIKDAKKAESYLTSKGWVHSGYGNKSCNADAGTLWIRAGKKVLEWHCIPETGKFFVEFVGDSYM